MPQSLESWSLRQTRSGSRRAAVSPCYRQLTGKEQGGFYFLARFWPFCWIFSTNLTHLFSVLEGDLPVNSITGRLVEITGSAASITGKEQGRTKHRSFDRHVKELSRRFYAPSGLHCAPIRTLVESTLVSCSSASRPQRFGWKCHAGCDTFRYVQNYVQMRVGSRGTRPHPRPKRQSRQ